MTISRRKFIGTASLAGTALAVTSGVPNLTVEIPAPEVMNPMGRVPVSLIIDDSTCLVNMAHFGIPQFAEVFPDKYLQDWRKLPREIPDSFVREFGEWSLANGIKGKYSIVPYPACTGWINRFIPGWTKHELESSLNLVRELLLPNWDIHPEMISHTRVIDIKTGKPYPYPTPGFMENWEWSQNKSVDELAAYQAYALSILKDAGLPCEGLTTPGGYGGKNQKNLSLSTLEAVREVYKTEIPHYFRDLFTEKEKSVAPQVLNASGLNGPDPRCVVSIIGCTGDWFGGWDGLEKGNADNLITDDLRSGRMVEVIESGEPAIMVCHWPGIYFNGEKTGFQILKTAVDRLKQRYNNLIWMKLSEIARYWAARELTTILPVKNGITLKAPFGAPAFTLKTNVRSKDPVYRNAHNLARPFVKVRNLSELKPFHWYSENSTSIFCFDLEQGTSFIDF